SVETSDPGALSLVEEIMREPQLVPATAGNRVDRIRAALSEIFEDLSGLRLSDVDTRATFLEMGFDSLFLTQVTQELQAKFALKIPLRQLLDRESTRESLSAFIGTKLPGDAFSVAPAPASAADPAVHPQIDEVGRTDVRAPAVLSTGPAPASSLGLP